MVEIRLRNSRSRQVETLTPLDPARGVRMYLCGPTVYDRAHLGNARPSIVFDVLYRLLRHVSPENGWAPPVYVRNFTDVDDKINARAAETGRPIGEITEETIGWYHADMDALGILRPDHEPRATDYIAEMVSMIETLIAEGHAYEAEGHVLFAVDSWREGYGQLSGRSVDDMIAGARVEVAPYKRNPMDFVLWKPSSGDLPGWDSPWGRGRPGWHIECSAMSKAILGEVFDIHGGGNDLMFPHHENEIAQSCCANGTERMAQIWLHNEMLQVEGKKMSKSLGNFFTVRDLLDQGVPGEVIRFVFLGTHYSKPMDWTERKREEAEKTLWKWSEAAKLAQDRVGDARGTVQSNAVISSLATDLNTYNARQGIEVLVDHVLNPPRMKNVDQEGWERTEAEKLLNGLDILGLGAIVHWERKRHLMLDDLAGRLDQTRTQAIAQAQLPGADKAACFAPVDALKSALIAAGVEVRMSKEGVELIPGPGFDPSKLEGL